MGVSFRDRRKGIGRGWWEPSCRLLSGRRGTVHDRVSRSRRWNRHFLRWGRRLVHTVTLLGFSVHLHGLIFSCDCLVIRGRHVGVVGPSGLSGADGDGASDLSWGEAPLIDHICCALSIALRTQRPLHTNYSSTVATTKEWVEEKIQQSIKKNIKLQHSTELSNLDL